MYNPYKTRSKLSQRIHSGVGNQWARNINRPIQPQREEGMYGDGGDGGANPFNDLISIMAHNYMPSIGQFAPREVSLLYPGGSPYGKTERQKNPYEEIFGGGLYERYNPDSEYRQTIRFRNDTMRNDPLLKGLM